nr:vigilin-like [Lytechinus pictus]
MRAKLSEQASFTADVHAKPEYHRFLIGRGGANIRKVREETGARVVFPNNNDDDQTLVQIIGTKEAVEEAKKRLASLIKDLVLREIGDEYGGVTVSFPRNGSSSTKVTIKGARDCVAGAKKRILEIVSDLEQQVSIECIIAQKFHGTVMGPKGSRIQTVTQEYEVAIKALVPITQEVNVPFDYHRYIIGAKGAGVRHMMEENDVTSEQSDVVIVRGTPANVSRGVEALIRRVKELDDEQEDRVRAVIGKIRSRHEVNIQFPARNQEDQDTIKIMGYEVNAQAAKEEILAIVKELEDQVSVELDIDHRIHRRLIGARGKAINRIMDDYKVDIRFPREEDPNPNLVVVTGDADNVDECCDYLKNLEEEYMMDVTETRRCNNTSEAPAARKRKRPRAPTTPAL